MVTAVEQSYWALVSARQDAALRADTVNPQGLGMHKVCGEDSVRRAFADVNPQACAAWQSGALQHTWAAALRWPWPATKPTTGPGVLTKLERERKQRPRGFARVGRRGAGPRGRAYQWDIDGRP